MKLLTSILAVLIPIMFAAASAETEWVGIREEADALFESGEFVAAAAKYNLSGQMALATGSADEARQVFSALGECFRPGRLDDNELLFEFVDSIGRAYIAVARNQSFDLALQYLLTAHYLFTQHGIEDGAQMAKAAHEDIVRGRVETLIAQARGTSSTSPSLAGMAYFEAASLLRTLDDAAYMGIYGLASEHLERHAEAAAQLGDAWNLSEAALSYRLASTAAQQNLSEAGGLILASATLYLEAGESFDTEGELNQALKSFRAAAAMYERSGRASADVHRRAAEVAGKLAQETTQYGPHLSALASGREYDAAGLHREAAGAYLLALEIFPYDLPLPWLQAEFLEILGASKRTIRARTHAGLLADGGLDIVSFLASPTFGGYDIMRDLGPGLTESAGIQLLPRLQTIESLLIAAGFLVSNRPDEAATFMEETLSEGLSLDPPARALHDLLLAAIKAQKGVADRTGYHASKALLVDAYVDGFVSILDESPLGAGYFPVPRRRNALEYMLADLDRSVDWALPLEEYLSDLEMISEEISEAETRNATMHAGASELISIIGYRSMYGGDLNISAGYFERACYHACAGEQYQKAVYYHDLTVGNLDARTFLSAAAFVVADAMIQGNETSKVQAREFIANVSGNLDPRELAVLLSVLDGTTDLGGISSLAKNLGMGFIAAFVLVTAYVVLLWEPKHGPGSQRATVPGPDEPGGGGGEEAATPAAPAETEAEDQTGDGAEAEDQEGKG